MDVKLFGKPISIKTMTGKKPGGIKISWTVDAEQARRFSQDYIPHCDMLLAHVNWDEMGGLYLIPCEVQNEVMSQMGRQGYIKLPKAGTNPRGVEVSGKALDLMIDHPQSRRILINWQRQKMDYNPYDRWLELWQRD